MVSEQAEFIAAVTLETEDGCIISDQVSDLGFALLRMMHRAAQGGPRLPAGASMTDAYRELEICGLAVDGEITLQGENLLYQRYANP